MKFLEKAAKLNQTRKEKGFRGVKQSFYWFYRRYSDMTKYRKWIKAHRISDEDRQKIRIEIKSFDQTPLISIVLPVFNVEEKFLRRCIESVRNQLYENWELCIADDCSPSEHIRRILEEYAEKEKRIKIVFRAENGHISAASNSALELAGGEFTALLDHDDELSEDALFYVAREINEFPEAALIYSDEDLMDEKGRRFDPKFKPDWSRDHFYSGNITTHLSAYRTEILRQIGGFTVGLEGSQDYDLTLRVIEQIDEKQIRHIPQILYHWRVIRGSVAYDGGEKPYAHEAARRAIGAHLARTGKKATVEAFDYLHRVRYELPENLPKVSLILLADDDDGFTKQSVGNFRRETDYQDFEIILTAKSSEIAGEAERLNRAVSDASGEIFCFIDANLRPLAKDWLKELVSFAIQKEIGAVGAKLLYKNETILHGGLLIGINDSVGIAHHNLPRDKNGYLMRAQIINNFSAVSVSCLAMRHELFTEFDAENFPNKFFDVDLCLKLLSQGFRNVFAPYAELMQIDERRILNVQKKGSEKELVIFRQKWSDLCEKDPFYNPNLSKESEVFAIDVR